MDEDRASELIQELGELILREPIFANDEWKKFALVAKVEDWLSLSGYVYDGTSSKPISIDNIDILEGFVELRKATQKEGKPNWVCCLVQFVRESMSIDIDFEYEDPDRWQTTPSNYEELPSLIEPS